jgi:sulfur carrier protein ThiS
MKVLFINNHGGGFADHIEINAGTTVANLFAQRLPGCKAGDYLIRVNRLPTSSDQVLQEGDRVSITPTKIEGAIVVA